MLYILSSWVFWGAFLFGLYDFFMIRFAKESNDGLMYAVIGEFNLCLS